MWLALSKKPHQTCGPDGGKDGLSMACQLRCQPNQNTANFQGCSSTKPASEAAVFLFPLLVLPLNFGSSLYPFIKLNIRKKPYFALTELNKHNHDFSIPVPKMADWSRRAKMLLLAPRVGVNHLRHFLLIRRPPSKRLLIWVSG